MADPYYSELLGGSSNVMGEPQEIFDDGESWVRTPGGGGGGGIGGGCGFGGGNSGSFGGSDGTRPYGSGSGGCGLHVTPRLLTVDDSDVCLRMSARGTYVSHSTREERHGRPGPYLSV